MSSIGDNAENNETKDSVSLMLDRYNKDWMNHYVGQSQVVLRPRTVDQVARILTYCASQRLPLVPQGGNTGLVGGSVATGPKELVLSLERLNQIYHVDAVTGLLYCQAGCILNDLQEHCANHHNLLVPLDLGAKGTCQIGGNVATNAGGPYYYRYGSLAANLVGLQVVWPNGGAGSPNQPEASVVNLNFSPTTNQNNDKEEKKDDDADESANVSEPTTTNTTTTRTSLFHSNLKDNTGYKLSQLMIGSEGTLGVITGVALKCPPLPFSRQAAFLACHSFDHVVQLIHLAKQELGEILAAFEWMDQTIVELIQQTHPHVRVPVTMEEQADDTDGAAERPYPHSILLETHGSCEEHDMEKLDGFLTKAMESSSHHQQQEGGDPIVANGVMAQDLSQLHEFWNLRELAGPSIVELGYGYKYDVSLPVSEFAEFGRDVQQHVQDTLKLKRDDDDDTTNGLVEQGPALVCTNWGHVLDGNLHLNFTTPGEFHVNDKVLQCLEPYVFDQVLERGGSISAEHGIGQMKRPYLSRVHDPAVLATMRALKQVFDPVGILNPHKVLPPAT